MHMKQKQKKINRIYPTTYLSVPRKKITFGLNLNHRNTMESKQKKLYPNNDKKDYYMDLPHPPVGDGIIGKRKKTEYPTCLIVQFENGYPQ